MIRLRTYSGEILLNEDDISYVEPYADNNRLNFKSKVYLRKERAHHSGGLFVCQETFDDIQEKILRWEWRKRNADFAQT